MREQTYPYTPLRALYLHRDAPSGEKYTMWLVVFLMRLNMCDYMSVKNVKEFVERQEVVP